VRVGNGDPRRAVTVRRLLLVAVVGLVVAVVGAVVGVHLANEARSECGDNIYRLIDLVCTHVVHPHARAGWLTVVISVFVGSALAVAALVRLRRVASAGDD
jgi:hypothetical protein